MKTELEKQLQQSDEYYEYIDGLIKKFEIESDEELEELLKPSPLQVLTSNNMTMRTYKDIQKQFEEEKALHLEMYGPDYRTIEREYDDIDIDSYVKSFQEEDEIDEEEYKAYLISIHQEEEPIREEILIFNSL
ncbi:hypothetical protein SIO70_11780 [Chitinophaga sancti]|uniref:hypothetical protein n=1 Tax=Chitinophaga sancti TaxID=1004 RepID=UPI002A750F78|nr:hypothetical protein [Chitinophaga sancti]WPQ65528.1 hypothetical protein SIO70_11780 [Chitinophaga sancti]